MIKGCHQVGYEMMLTYVRERLPLRDIQGYNCETCIYAYILQGIQQIKHRSSTVEYYEVFLLIYLGYEISILN